MAEPVLDILDLSKRFGGLKATDGVSLDLRRGEIHALIGPNGAGKTTLIHQICGSVKPDSGSIRFLGQDILGLDVPARARLGLGRTFQISSLALDFSALRNVMLAVQSRQGSSFRFLRNAMADASLTGPAREALDRVGLGGRGSVPAAELSHGERRQLEIAIALALGSKALLLDEPMAGMGHEDIEKIQNLIKRISAKYTILMVEHNLSVVANLSDIITVLTRGQVLAEGNYAELTKDARVTEAYLGVGHA